MIEDQQHEILVVESGGGSRSESYRPPCVLTRLKWIYFGRLTTLPPYVPLEPRYPQQVFMAQRGLGGKHAGLSNNKELVLLY